MNAGRWQISTGGGVKPLWSPDGTELFYLNDGSVIKVPVETEKSFENGKPVTLFSGSYISEAAIHARPWDISPDGKRFLILKRSPTSEDASQYSVPRKLNIVLNWFEELKELVP